MNITLPYAGVLGLILIVLTVRVVAVVRAQGKIIYGDGGNPAYTPIVRAQANFVEFVPIALILMALLEMNGTSATLIHGLGVALVVARVVHPFGLKADRGPTAARLVGALGTWLVIAVASVAAIASAI